MANRKTSLTRVFVWLALVVAIGAGWFWFQRAKRDVMERANPALRTHREREEQIEAFNATTKQMMLRAFSNSRPRLIHRAGELPDDMKTDIAKPPELTAADMADFTNRFEKRFVPAIAKWCKVYEGRIPFQANDVTIDKFHSRVGGFLYTFMIGSTTFTVYDGPAGTRVFYMMTKQAATELNNLPKSGAPSNVAMPVTRPVITGLLKADSGIDYPPDQVSMHPTASFSAMSGGVMVEAGGITGNNVFRAMTDTNLDFVLDGSGMMVSYQH